jgi:hypothetical protein
MAIKNVETTNLETKLSESSLESKNDTFSSNIDLVQAEKYKEEGNIAFKGTIECINKL